MTVIRAIVFGVAMLLAPIGAVNATVIYAQGQSAAFDGGYSGNNPFSQGNTYVAQDFSVSGSYTLGSATFNSYTQNDTVAITHFGIKIYANNAGAIGSLLYNEDVYGANSGTLTCASCNGYRLRDYTFGLTGNFLLTTGSYWVAMHVDPDQGNMHWTIPNPYVVGLQSMISNAGDNNYTAYTFDHTFRLESASAAVPEPASLALLGLALAGLGFSRRKKA